MPCLAAEPVPLCVGNYPPYNSHELPDNGPVLQIATEAFRHVGLPVSISFLPWVRLLKQAEAGECAIVGIWRNAERDRLYDFSAPIVRQELGLFGPVGTPVKQLSGQLIGVERGSYLPAQLLEKDVLRYQVLGVRQNFTMLHHGRIALAFADRAAGEYLLRQQPEMALKIEWKEPRLEFKDAYLAGHRRYPLARAWVQAFDRGLSAMKADGSYQRILKKAGLLAPS
ncbi:transporter substrate-binding domain-containing protein [Paucibacter sp. APW11]|uniref:Transporter substrate-binding domain-containing protein n=1 Tax=Roseateles aquae TaxID=3077235 RepID=A0ABU3PB38_9BURK|nr:transporter substrate-binding domain-containing protein [Paucibacter sp. APW11]MDT8999777.1 transporter substrate-binding domain-containing protein [Paucibacter sp. APW11]